MNLPPPLLGENWPDIKGGGLQGRGRGTFSASSCCYGQCITINAHSIALRAMRLLLQCPCGRGSVVIKITWLAQLFHCSHSCSPIDGGWEHCIGTNHASMWTPTRQNGDHPDLSGPSSRKQA